MTREQAKVELNVALYGEQELRGDMDHIARKLDITVDEFRAILSQPNKHYSDYGYYWTIDFSRRAKHKGVSYATRYLFHGTG